MVLRSFLNFLQAEDGNLAEPHVVPLDPYRSVYHTFITILLFVYCVNGSHFR